ncbi:GNAT family N-acetyltransferase [Paenibacillus sp. AR247]|uniref:GNAT family N-acetyltransferase n=1 Tax=Paenibacillus sp. AR247 TaxID=1631599 RepID=UPI000CF9B2C6|nr:GNAT family N-acetyltransferase [Paenibacillus sp. AR247]PQP85943.1 GNAT family N-acetyltransferase [Paenibacillus sp. AR247]
MNLTIRSAEEKEIDLIVSMNKKLIEDEGSTNPMNRDELKERMLNWLRTGWNIDLLCIQDRIIGYALYQFGTNPFDEKIKEVYVRQYFISRNERNHGYGMAGVRLLKEQRFKDIQTIIIDVLETNPTGKRFWEKAGFKPYYTNMRLE